MTTDLSTATAARRLSVAARSRDLWHAHTMLVLPSHADLGVGLSTDTHWFYLPAADGTPAVWDVLWLEALGDATDVEGDAADGGYGYQDYEEVSRHECGTFTDLLERVGAILENPRRVAGSAVDVQINEWALLLQLPLLHPAPACARTTVPTSDRTQ